MVALGLADGDERLRDRHRRRGHLRPVPAGDPDVPQRRQGAARRARLLLPAAHRGQHGVHRARHQLRAAAVQARRRRGPAAEQHPRARRARSSTSRTSRSGVIPVMKLLEDSFSYANQLGARQGAGAVYLHAHHPDIMRFLDTKRENADEKIRIKTLSLGVVIPDITFELAKKNEDMYLFSPVRRRARLRHAVRRHLRHREVRRDGRRRPDQEDQDQRPRVLPDARRAAVRVRLPVHHVRGHGEPGEPDRRQDHALEPVLGDPAGLDAVDVQRGPLVQPRSAATSPATSAR